jgi:hypothetical protein
MIGTFWEDENHFMLVLLRAGECTWRTIDLYSGVIDHVWLQDDKMRVIGGKHPWLTKVEDI